MTNHERAAKLKEFVSLGFDITGRSVAKARANYGRLYLALQEEKTKPDGNQQMVSAAFAILGAD